MDSRSHQRGIELSKKHNCGNCKFREVDPDREPCMSCAGVGRGAGHTYPAWEARVELDLPSGAQAEKILALEMEIQALRLEKEAGQRLLAATLDRIVQLEGQLGAAQEVVRLMKAGLSEAGES